MIAVTATRVDAVYRKDGTEHRVPVVAWHLTDGTVCAMVISNEYPGELLICSLVKEYGEFVRLEPHDDAEAKLTKLVVDMAATVQEKMADIVSTPFGYDHRTPFGYDHTPPAADPPPCFPDPLGDAESLVNGAVTFPCVDAGIPKRALTDEELEQILPMEGEYCVVDVTKPDGKPVSCSSRREAWRVAGNAAFFANRPNFRVMIRQPSTGGIP